MVSSKRKKILSSVDYQQSSESIRLDRSQELQAPAYKLFSAQSKGHPLETIVRVTSETVSPQKLIFGRNEAQVTQVSPAESIRLCSLELNSASAIERQESVTSGLANSENLLLEYSSCSFTQRVTSNPCLPSVARELSESGKLGSGEAQGKLEQMKRQNSATIEDLPDSDAMISQPSNSPKTPTRGRAIGKHDSKSPLGLHGFLSEQISHQIFEKRKRVGEMHEKLREMKRMKEVAEHLEKEKAMASAQLGSELSVWEGLAAEMEARAREAREKANDEKKSMEKKLLKMEKEYMAKIAEARKKSEQLGSIESQFLKESKEVEAMEAKKSTAVADIESKILEQANELLSHLT